MPTLSFSYLSTTCMIGFNNKEVEIMVGWVHFCHVNVPNLLLQSPWKYLKFSKTHLLDLKNDVSYCFLVGRIYFDVFSMVFHGSINFWYGFLPWFSIVSSYIRSCYATTFIFQQFRYIFFTASFRVQLGQAFPITRGLAQTWFVSSVYLCHRYFSVISYLMWH